MASQETTSPGGDSHDESLARSFGTLLRFFVVVRYRKRVVLAAMAAAVLLGGLYFTSAVRYYQSKASLMVMYMGGDSKSGSINTATGIQQDIMPTFENLLTSEKVINRALDQLKPEDCIDLTSKPRSKWVSQVQKSLTARTVHNTKIINVSYYSRSPTAAARMVGAIVQSYISVIDETGGGLARELIRVLTKEKASLAERLAQKEKEMLELQCQVKDLPLRNDAKALTPVVQQAVSFNESMIEAQKRRIELEALQVALQSAIRNGEDLQQYVLTLGDLAGKEVLLRTLGFDTQDTSSVAVVERSVLDDRAELRTLQEHLGPNHPEVIAKAEKIRQQEQFIAEYQQKITERMRWLQKTQLGPMLVQTVEQKLGETQRLEEALRLRFEQARDEAVGLSGQIARLQIVEHDLEDLRKANNALLDRIMNINPFVENADIRTALLEEPSVADLPSSPSLSLVCAIVLLSGMAVGLGMVYAMDIMDDHFRSLDELQAQLGIPVLTLIRQLRMGEGSGIEGIHMHVAPDSTESESFRTLRTALALADRETRRLVISSSEPGDGKTTVLVNLAVCYAQADKKTLLIDADLRRPGLTTLLGMRSIEGLSRILRGEEDVAEMAVACIRHSGIDGLDVISSGARVPNPNELLSGPRFSELLAWAETLYDQILVDCPPTLVTSDVAVIGRQVDGVILVVQPDKNRRRQVLRTTHTLMSLKVPLLGVIVNRVHSDKDQGYYGYSSGYGYGYGYGYGHGYHYGDDTKETKAEDAAPQAAMQADVAVAEDELEPDPLSFVDRPEQDGVKRPGIVPRRVA